MIGLSVALMRRAWKQEGFDVVCAHDGEEALQKLGEFTPDLILLDLIMPNKNGFEFLEAIKPDAKLKKYR